MSFRAIGQNVGKTLMQYKPIVVINERHSFNTFYFDDIHLAEKHVEKWGGKVYRREDWYQHLQMWLDILIRRA